MTSANDCMQRRRDVCANMQSHEAVWVSTSAEQLRNGDAYYPFRAHSDFYYLTGITEPGAMALLLPDGRGGHEYILFCHAKDPEKACWDGAWMGQEAAVAEHGVDRAFSLADADAILPKLLLDRRVWWTSVAHHPMWQARLTALQTHRQKVALGTIIVEDVSHKLHAMRLIKRPSEIALIERAVAISVDAHTALMQACRPGLYERDLAGVLWQRMLAAGSEAPAYNHIVAAGPHACVLHHQRLDGELKSGDLLLVDAGAEWSCYAADITRTLPINGRFSSAQRAIYDLVLATQEALIAMVRPGLKWCELQNTSVQMLTQGLVDLGILKGKVSDLIESKAYRAYYMHGVGHWLGLDVHDAGDYGHKRDKRLEPGMVLTVEPGLYLDPSRGALDPQWHHIGVRIEDDVLVTEKGCRVLSEALPKRPEDIEHLMQSAQQ